MRNCTSCQHALESDAKFCTNCGEKQVIAIFCQVCGLQLEKDEVCKNCVKEEVNQFFCTECGVEIDTEHEKCSACLQKASQLETNSVENVMNHSTNSEVQKKSSKKVVSIMASLIGIVVIVFFAMQLLSGGNSNSNYSYVKNGDIYFAELAKEDKLNLTDGVSKGPDQSGADVYSLESRITISSDNKFMIFPYGTEDYYSATYYVKELKEDAEAFKIDSGIYNLTLLEKENKVVYLKENDALYVYDLKTNDKTKLVSEVEDFIVSLETNEILYQDYNENYYFLNLAGDKEKFGSELVIEEYNNDFSEFYYMKNGNLYIQERGQEAVKIVSDISSVERIYNNGEIYYTKEIEETVKLSNFVIDDMKEDEQIQPVEYPEEPYYDFWLYTEDDAAYEKYLEDYAKYELEIERYYNYIDIYDAKEYRDYLRAELEEETTIYKTELYFYDGKESILVDGNVDWIEKTSAYSPVIIYQGNEVNDIVSLKLSEITEVWEVEDAIAYPMIKEYYSVAIDSTVTDLQESDVYISKFLFTSDNKELYYVIPSQDDEELGDLKKVTFADNKVTKPELVKEEIASESVSLLNGENLVYYLDVYNYTGDLYLNNVKIDSDVLIDSEIVIDNKTVFYYTDWSEKSNQGTVKISENGKIVKMADDVYNLYIFAIDQVLYLTDYSQNYHVGDLYFYNGGKENTKVDSDVSIIIPLN